MSDWSCLEFQDKALNLDKGELLFEQGHIIRKMFYLETGRVKLVRHNADGDTIVLHIATSGEMIAEPSFFSDQYHCDAQIDQTSTIRCINRTEALDHILSEANSSRKVLALFARQIRELRGLIEIRNIRAARPRILTYLESIANKEGQIQLTMSLKDMAYKLGLAHETLYRELKQLEDQNKLIRQSKTSFILPK